jgi:predicted acylesterase/phospholipase RssA
MVDFFDEIIISSGGNKGIALIGALNKFFNYYPIQRIKYYTGTSIGALICLLLNIGYTINELNDIIFKIDFLVFQELKIVNLIDKLGLDEGNKFTNLFKALVINKNLNINITFKELYVITNKVLTISVANISRGIVEYHNYLNTPDLNIILSLRMSMNVPILFCPILYNNNYYIDGALLEPFPYFYNKNTKKIGFWVFENYEFNFIKDNNVIFMNEITNFVVSTIVFIFVVPFRPFFIV